MIKGEGLLRGPTGIPLAPTASVEIVSNRRIYITFSDNHRMTIIAQHECCDISKFKFKSEHPPLQIRSGARILAVTEKLYTNVTYADGYYVDRLYKVRIKFVDDSGGIGVWRFERLSSSNGYYCGYLDIRVEDEVLID